MLGGTAQELGEDHTLVAFGNGERVQEFDASGAVVWEIHGNAGYIYRANSTPGAYRERVGAVATSPASVTSSADRFGHVAHIPYGG